MIAYQEGIMRAFKSQNIPVKIFEGFDEGADGYLTSHKCDYGVIVKSGTMKNETSSMAVNYKSVKTIMPEKTLSLTMTIIRIINLDSRWDTMML